MTIPGTSEGHLKNNSGNDPHPAIQRLPMLSTGVINWYPICTPGSQRRVHLLTSGGTPVRDEWSFTQVSLAPERQIGCPWEDSTGKWKTQSSLG